MTDRIRADTGELAGLAAAFERAPDELADRVEKITQVAMIKMKKGAQAIVAGHAHLPHLGRSFTYTVSRRRDEIIGEVGAETRKRQGSIDQFIENGTVRNAPIPHWSVMRDREEPIWERLIGDAMVEVIDD